jgi:hypothetical protein
VTLVKGLETANINSNVKLVLKDTPPI